MALYRNNGELLTERRGIIDAVVNSLGKSDQGSRILRRGRRLGRITKHRLSRWLLLLTALFSFYFTVCGLKMFIHDGSITAKMGSSHLGSQRLIVYMKGSTYTVDMKSSTFKKLFHYLNSENHHLKAGAGSIFLVKLNF
ncbi:hypothetical protein HN51_037735 [Arachis hypogaea]